MLQEPLRPAGPTEGPKIQRHHYVREPAGTIPIIVRIYSTANLLVLVTVPADNIPLQPVPVPALTAPQHLLLSLNLVVTSGTARHRMLERFSLHSTIQTAAQHRLEVALIPTQLLITDPSLAQNLPRSSKDHLASARASFGIGIGISILFFWPWARAADKLGEIELQTEWPAFAVLFGTDTTELIVFHTPPPVRLPIEKLAEDPARTVLLHEI